MAKFTEVTSRQAVSSLGRKLIPVADQLRDLYSRFGLRAYRVTIVRVVWSGGKRGKGTALVASETPILPTPRISPLNGLAEIAQTVGLDEVGGLELSEISGTFTEEQIRGFPAGGTMPQDAELIYEVEFFPQTVNSPSVKRRFYSKSAPSYEAGRLQWTVRLEKANENRASNGDPR